MGERVAASEDDLDVVPDRTVRRGNHPNDPRRGRERALPGTIEQTLGRQLLPQQFELKRGKPEAGGLDDVDVQLQRAVPLVHRDVAVRGNLIANLGKPALADGMAAKQRTLELAVLAAQREVDVPRLRPEEVGDLALHPDVGE